VDCLKYAVEERGEHEGPVYGDWILRVTFWRKFDFKAVKTSGVEFLSK